MNSAFFNVDFSDNMDFKLVYFSNTTIVAK